MAGRDWASLPSELLDLIVGKLKPAEDYVRFRATCKPCRSAASHQIRQRRRKKHPMLVREITRFKDEEEEEENVEIALFALKQLGSSSVISSGLILRPLNSVPPFYKAENHGWLASLDEWLALTLSNPFTGQTISLPPIKETKETTPRERCMLYRSASYSLYRVALSADPDLFPDDFEVLVQVSRFLAHCKSGDESWTCSTVSFTSIDLAYWKGRFVVLTECPVNLTTKFAFNLICVPTITSCPDRPRTPRISSMYSDKIVESSGGDLLLVKMFWYLTTYSLEKEEEKEVNVIRIFKLMLGDSAGGVEQSKWVEIKSIGSDALFLDLGKLICVSALDFPDQCRRNCIYCTDGLKYGVFNLEDGVMEKWNEFVDPYENHLRRIWLSWALPTIV